jgi:hypothetical protein
VIRQAAGIAQSWRANSAAAYQDYLDACAEYQEESEGDPPEWTERHTSVLKRPVTQANANLALLQPSEDSMFDYWLRLSTLEHGQPVSLPVQLANYHRQALAGKTLNTSTVLTRKADGWWLTRSHDQDLTVTTPPRRARDRRRRGHRCLPHHLDGPALRHVPWQAGRTPPAGPPEAPPQSKAAGVPEDELRQGVQSRLARVPVVLFPQ